MDEQEMDALRRQATSWIVRLRSGQATTDDRDAFLRWRGESARHEQALQEALQLWNAIGEAATTSPARQRPIVSRRAFLVSGGAAAGLTGVAAGLSAVGVLPSLAQMTADYVTVVGEQRDFRLPDGSIASLDGATVISSEFSEQTRRVRLSSGAAVFDVTQRSGVPFEVETENGLSSTEGGSLAVRQGASAVAVDCLSGQVSVRCLGVERLMAGEGVFYSDSGLGPKRSIQADITTAWRNGMLVFRDQPLAEVVADLNRHRKGRVIIAGGSAGARRVSGVFHLSRPQEIVSHLKNTLHLVEVSLPGGIVLLR